VRGADETEEIGGYHDVWVRRKSKSEERTTRKGVDRVKGRRRRTFPTG
jgi:hypothetical protein